MKRLCIYLTYDKQKVVDNYIGYMLKELKTCADCLVVVCNETEVIRGDDILQRYADEIFYRKNLGFDAGGFKDALCDFVGWDKVLAYNELVLVNDSFFGPFRPMVEIFREMEKRQIDFWGLTKHAECDNKSAKYTPEHIQSFFLTIRENMMHDKDFCKYWSRMPYYTSYDEVIRQHELVFTPFFSEKGYVYGTYADTEVNDSANIANNFNQYVTLSYELMRKRNFPFLKKKQLSYATYDIQTQENLWQSLDYIDKSTDYDVNYIWENIIRTMDVSDLQRSLQLQYILPKSQTLNKRKSSMAVVAVLEFESSCEYVEEYFDRLMEGRIGIRVVSDNPNILLYYQKKGYLCSKAESDTEWYDIIYEVCKFDCVCILHDMDMTSDVERSCTTKSFFYGIWENLVSDNGRVCEIGRLFEENKKLGFLAPPRPVFDRYFRKTGWEEHYKDLESICNRMKLDCQISLYKEPFVVTDDFWIRGSILKRLLEKDRQFQCIHLLKSSILRFLWIYIVQDAGCYSGIVETSEYAAMNEVNGKYYLDTIADRIRQMCGGFEDFSAMKKVLFQSVIEQFCNRFSHIYVYGIGDMARKYEDVIKKVDAYIISDGQPNPAVYNEKKVYFLSEIELSKNVGIIVCLNEKNQQQVMNLLDTTGFCNYICI